MDRQLKPVNKEIQKKAIGDEKPITCRLADTLDPELEKLEKEMDTVERTG